MIDWTLVQASADAERERIRGLTAWSVEARIGAAVVREVRRQQEAQP